MTRLQPSTQVPEAMQARCDRIVALTDTFAKEHLNDEYAQLMRTATTAMCRQHASLISKGLEKSWACGIAHAIGTINVLFAPSQEPYISAADLYRWFEVGASTGQSKSKIVRDTLDMSRVNPNWVLPSLVARNPFFWTITVDGLPVDVRSAPRELQESAYQKGLIPYIPGESRAEESPPETLESSPPQPEKEVEVSPDALYVLDVFLIGGPVDDEFIKKNRVISRRIEIQGKNTLEDLHHIIFDAFDRYDEHLYEFQVGGRGPQDPNARRYGLSQQFASMFPDDDRDGDVSSTAIADLGLAVKESFCYWFDFGDDWWHQIEVVKISNSAPQEDYPKITKKVGASPPQYEEFDEDEEDDEDD